MLALCRLVPPCAGPSMCLNRSKKGVDGGDKRGHDEPHYWHGLVSRISSVVIVPVIEKSP
jgi:hypothetical protein